MKFNKMELKQINQTLILLADKLPSESIPMIRQRLVNNNFTQEEIIVIYSRMKNPTISLVLSIVLGYLGIDRFYIGDTGMGIGKLLTCGGLYIWWIIDMSLIMNATKQKNLELFLMATSNSYSL